MDPTKSGNARVISESIGAAIYPPTGDLLQAQDFGRREFKGPLQVNAGFLEKPRHHGTESKGIHCCRFAANYENRLSMNSVG